MNRLLQVTSVAIATLSIQSRANADWMRFRGPNGSGISKSAVPIEFGEEKHLKWKARLPGRGISSPIVVGEKVLVTCYSGYGMGNGDGEMEDLKRHLICFDRTTGKQRWIKTVEAKMPEGPFVPPGVTTHGYASNTPASDGERVFAFFGKSGVYAYDLEGNELWNQSVGQEPSFKGFGSAASPIVVGNDLVVNAADESLSIFWLDKRTGKVKHRAEADGLGECWTTPIEIENEGKSEIAISVIGEIWGLNNQTGKLSWYANGVNSRNAQVSLIADSGVIYATGEEGYAVKVGGKDDVSKANTIWEGRVRTRYATPVLVDGRLYSISGTVVESIDAKTGERIFQDRLPEANGTGVDSSERQFGSRGGFGGGRGGRGGPSGGDYASPVVADDKIYVTMNDGTIHVIAAEPEFKVLATNSLSFDSSGFGATPAISKGALFLRSNTHLYCVSE